MRNLDGYLDGETLAHFAHTWRMIEDVSQQRDTHERARSSNVLGVSSSRS